MVGEGVYEHVRRLRLERAAQRLKLQEQPVTDIAFEAGYESHEAFTRAFHAMFGKSPSEFREPFRYQPPDCDPPPVEVKTLPPQTIVFLRHAGVMALTWIAEKYPELVLAKAADQSVSVRMAVCLVLRRLEDARIAQFLADKNSLVVLEAARAINDVPIPAAFDALAAFAAPAAAKQRAPEDLPGGFTFKAEYWEKLQARTYADFLKHVVANPKPDKEETLTGLFETPSDRADYYGSRVSGLR